jgi:CRISPR-associated protein Cas1
MDKRLIDFSEKGASLSVRLEQLVIKIDDDMHTVPLEELGAIVVSHPAVHYTHAVLSGLCANGGVFIICDEKRMPIGMLMPLAGNIIQTERIAAQSKATAALKKNLWKTVVKAKIEAQASLLKKLIDDDKGLKHMARKVRSGDSANLEGLAARRYWPALFGRSFRRIPGATDPVNRALNYGYAVLRAVTARAITAAGLHPSIGLHHHNRYNPFCLVDDIMEPYRPLVDRIVHKLLQERGPSLPLDRETKEKLIKAMVSLKYDLNQQSRTMFDVASRSATSLADIFTGKKKRLTFAKLPYE